MNERGTVGALPRGRRLHGALACLLVLVYTAWTVALMRTVDATHDEPTYLRAGRAVLEEGWGGERTYFHGPLPLLMTRLVPPPAEDAPPYQESLFRARLGTLPFGWLAAACCYALARRAYGARAGLLALLLFCLNPLLLGFGALATVDLGQAAGIALVLVLVLRYAERGSLGRAAAIGLALGVTFSIKYLSLLFGPPVAIVVAALAWHERRDAGSSIWRRARRSGFAALVVTACAIFALHAACGFRTGCAAPDPAQYRSELIRGIASLGGVSELLRVLPQGVLSGLDAYFWTWREPAPIYLRGALASRHADYFLWCFLVKTPELVLALFAAGCIAGLRRRRSERSPLAAIFAIVLLPPGLYLSVAHGTQLGIRYALAMLPPLLVLAARAAQWIPLARPRVYASSFGAIALLLALDTGSQSPHILGYFSRSAGGPRHAYRYFDGSNCDWGQLAHRGLKELRTSESLPFVALQRGDGPRFGRVAIYVNDRATPHPLDPSQSRHWLDAFEAVRHVGAAWWLYELDRSDFERARAEHGDPLLAEDLAIAELGAGEHERARALLQELRPVQRDRLVQVLALEEVLSTQQPFEPGPAWRLHELWLDLGRRDRARELIADPRLDASPAVILDQSRRLADSAEPRRARELLDDLLELRPALFADQHLVLRLVQLTALEDRYARALEILLPRLDAFSPEMRSALEPWIAELRARAAAVEASFAPR